MPVLPEALPEPSAAMAVVTSTTRPSISTSGPLELPGLIEASVWTIVCAGRDGIARVGRVDGPA